MKLSKKIIHSPAGTAFISWVLAMCIRIVVWTNRVERHIDPSAERYMKAEANAIFAFWHGRMMLLPAFQPRGRMMHVLISLHRDGTLISRVIGHFGQATVSGSSSRGGEAAVRDILRLLEHGDNISITPDGPRGPIQIAAKGSTVIAKLSGKPILPVTFSATRHKRMRSWDRFMVAKPFGKIVFCVGAPVAIDYSKDEEEARQKLEAAMNALVIKADAMTGA